MMHAASDRHNKLWAFFVTVIERPFVPFALARMHQLRIVHRRSAPSQHPSK